MKERLLPFLSSPWLLGLLLLFLALVLGSGARGVSPPLLLLLLDIILFLHSVHWRLLAVRYPDLEYFVGLVLSLLESVDQHLLKLVDEAGFWLQDAEDVLREVIEL